MPKENNVVVTLTKWLVIVPNAKLWCKHREFHNSRACLTGGLIAANQGNPASQEVVSALARTIEHHYIERCYSVKDESLVVMFNDDSRTTYKDVRRVVEKTIENNTIL